MGGDKGLDCEAGVPGAERSRRKRGIASSRLAVQDEPLPGWLCAMNLFRAGCAG